MINFYIEVKSGGGNLIPARVQNVQAIDMEGAVEVSWDELTGLIVEEDGEVVKYIIEKKVNEGAWNFERESEEEDWVAGFFIMDLNIEAGNTYYYRIKAQTNLGKETAWSEEASVTIEEEEEPTVPDKIESGAISLEVSFNYAKLNWDIPNNGGSPILGYKIYKQLSGEIESNWQSTEYMDFNVTPGGHVGYQVAAFNVIGEALKSNIRGGDVPGSNSWVPSPIAISPSQINITVTFPSRTIPHYWDIQRSLDNTTWATIATNQTSLYEDKGLEANTRYYYRIIMKNEFGDNGPSSSRNATTLESVERGTVTNITYASTYGSGQNFGYKQYVPAGYDGTTATPLVIWLHGLGERSTGNGNPQFTRLELYGPFKEYKDFEADYPFLMIAPQQPTDVDGKYTGRGSWDVEVIEESLNHFKAQGYNIDLDRVYITGQSMGGGGVLSYINSAYGNDTIAAALPIAATLPQGTGIACNIKHIPIWIFHAENDPTVPSSNSKNLYTAIKACTPAPDVEPKITIFDLSSHTGWNQVYRNTGAAITDYADNSPFPNGTTWEDWLLQYTLQAVEPEPETAPEQVTGLTATATAHNNINLSWNAPNDGGSPIIGYKIERRTSSGSFSDLVANTGNALTVYSDGSVSAETQYYYRVSAINAIGTGLASTSANATTPEIPDLENLIKINLGGPVNTAHPDPVLTGVDSTWFTIWHDVTREGAADYVLKNANNETTPYTLTAEDEDGGFGWGIVAGNSTGDVGAITGDNSGVVPDNVSRFYWFTNSASKPNGGIIRINNLPNGSKWNVKIFASRDGSDGRQSAATIGGIKKTVVAADNTSNWIEFEEVTISNNTIEILIKGEGQNFGYANAIILELLEEGSGPEKPTITVTATAPNENTIEIN